MPILAKRYYNPDTKEPFLLSRSKIELFFECPRCFYLDRRLGVTRPQGFPFNLNNAVDNLLKKEFDMHREEETPHVYMLDADIDAIPFKHKDLKSWRENFEGLRYHDKENNFIIFGAIDDVWKEVDTEKIIVVDYKATSKDTEVTIDEKWQDSYKRQVEIYNWLFKKMGFQVTDYAYFVYTNALKNNDAFEDRLDFETKLIKHNCNINWIEKTLKLIKKTLDSNLIPNPSSKTNFKGEDEICEYCTYREESGKRFIKHAKQFNTKS